MPRVAKSGFPGSHKVRRLTDFHIKNARPAAPGGRYTIWDGELPGFGLRVTDSGKKTFLVMRRIRGQAQPVRIEVKRSALIEARKLAQRYVDLMREGRDPRAIEAAEHEAEQAAQREADRLRENTFAARWQLYDQKHISTKRVRTQAEMRRPYRLHFEKAFGPRPLHEITRAEISTEIDKIAAPVAANRALTVLRGFFRWCANRGYVDADPCPLGRPNPEAEVDRTRVLSDDELKSVWLAAASLAYPYGPFIQLLVLTGQRRSEVAGLRWSEIDLDAKLWQLPAARNKAARDHVVPLSPLALQVLKELPRKASVDCALSTGGDVPLQDFSGTKTKIDELCTIAPWRLHDLRRSLQTGLERLGIAYETRRAVLNHSKASDEGVTSVYARYDYADEKRRALEKWSRHLTSVIGQASPNVVRLRQFARSK